ncbi:MAG: hypothetical protein LUD29_04630 [Clostridia bacterium]|nr:hypothetical protein [Clostridia bacterium]
MNIDDHYVRLFVNSSLTLAEFMLEVLERSHIE